MMGKQSLSIELVIFKWKRTQKVQMPQCNERRKEEICLKYGDPKNMGWREKKNIINNKIMQIIDPSPHSPLPLPSKTSSYLLTQFPIIFI